MVPSAMITAPPGARSIGPRLVSIPVTRLVPEAVGSVRKDNTCVSGMTINSLTASLPFESLAAVRAAFIKSGTTLNLFSGKKPAWGGLACTASGASSFSIFRRSV